MKLILENFWKIDYYELDLNKNFTLVSGINWVWKSTIFKAIAWWLYWILRVKDIDGYFENKSWVSKIKLLWFEFWDTTYDIEREFVIWSTISSNLYINGTKMEDNYVEEKILSYDYFKIINDYKYFSSLTVDKKINILNNVWEDIEWSLKERFIDVSSKLKKEWLDLSENKIKKIFMDYVKNFLWIENFIETSNDDLLKYEKELDGKFKEQSSKINEINEKIAKKEIDFRTIYWNNNWLSKDELRKSIIEKDTFLDKLKKDVVEIQKFNIFKNDLNLFKENKILFDKIKSGLNWSNLSISNNYWLLFNNIEINDILNQNIVNFNNKNKEIVLINEKLDVILKSSNDDKIKVINDKIKTINDKILDFLNKSERIKNQVMDWKNIKFEILLNYLDDLSMKINTNLSKNWISHEKSIVFNKLVDLLNNSKIQDISKDESNLLIELFDEKIWKIISEKEKNDLSSKLNNIKELKENIKSLENLKNEVNKEIDIFNSKKTNEINLLKENRNKLEKELKEFDSIYNTSFPLLKESLTKERELIISTKNSLKEVNINLLSDENLKNKEIFIKENENKFWLIDIDLKNKEISVNEKELFDLKKSIEQIDSFERFKKELDELKLNKSTLEENFKSLEIVNSVMKWFWKKLWENNIDKINDLLKNYSNGSNIWDLNIEFSRRNIVLRNWPIKNMSEWQKVLSSIFLIKIIKDLLEKKWVNLLQLTMFDEISSLDDFSKKSLLNLVNSEKRVLLWLTTNNNSLTVSNDVDKLSKILEDKVEFDKKHISKEKDINSWMNKRMKSIK